MYVVWSCVAGWVVVVVVIGGADRVGCLSLPLMKSLFIAFHFEPSSAVVSQVVSLMRSLVVSLLVLVGCS